MSHLVSKVESMGEPKEWQAHAFGIDRMNAYAHVMDFPRGPLYVYNIDENYLGFRW